MGICYSESPTLQNSSDIAGYSNAETTSHNSSHLTDSPSRASVHCLVSKEFEGDKADRLTVIDGNPESQSKICNLFGFKCIKGTKYNVPNQDDFFIVKDADFSLYGVLDGHGPEGHKVANYVEANLPQLIMSHVDFFTDPKSSIRHAFKTIEVDLSSMSSEQINAKMSGTTATIVLQFADRVLIAHVGDSKAVVLKKGEGDLEACYITQDHTPNRTDEARRINKLGGEIRSEGDESPHRFFQRGTNMPGLAVSRTLGDTKFHAFGLSYEPEIVELTLTPDIKYVIVATDGVWEFIKPSYAVKLLSRVEDVHKAADRIVQKAWDCWMYMEKATSDDITVVISTIPHI
mmetsp:Transcript_26194/g.46723  ORF Transcript_26194/g.46723 Transcript_26194/m.46723 type:complete len:346 (-) Transcript_26194:3528-4565(-)